MTRGSGREGWPHMGQQGRPRGTQDGCRNEDRPTTMSPQAEVEIGWRWTVNIEACCREPGGAPTSKGDAKPAQGGPRPRGAPRWRCKVSSGEPRNLDNSRRRWRTSRRAPRASPDVPRLKLRRRARTTLEPRRRWTCRRSAQRWRVAPGGEQVGPDTTSNRERRQGEHEPAGIPWDHPISDVLYLGLSGPFRECLRLSEGLLTSSC